MTGISLFTSQDKPLGENGYLLLILWQPCSNDKQVVAKIERSDALWASVIQPILKHRTLQLRRPDHFQRNPIYLEQRTTVGNRIRTDCGWIQVSLCEDYFLPRAQYTHGTVGESVLRNSSIRRSRYLTLSALFVVRVRSGCLLVRRSGRRRRRQGKPFSGFIPLVYRMCRPTRCACALHRGCARV